MHEYEVVVSHERLAHIANELMEVPWAAIDLETTGFDPHTCKIRLCSINTGRGVYIIDVFKTKTLGPVAQALNDSKCIKIGQYLKFDQKFLLKECNVELKHTFDSFRAGSLLTNGLGLGNNLYDLYARELQMSPQTGDHGGSDWGNSLSTEQLDYAADDVIHLPKLREALKPKLAEAGLNRIALIEFEAILPEASMELNGFYLDSTEWTALAKSNAIKREELRKELISKLPSPKKQMTLLGFEPDFNLSSTQQLLESLHMMGIKVPDTNEQTLAMVAGKYPIIDKIIEYRGYTMSVKTFGEGYLAKNINPSTGRVHTRFYPFTGAGRYSSADPNLQQIPRDKRFRKCFKAAPGYVFVIADYSQIELRIAGEIANDETLIQGYARGLDAHTLTASIISEKKLEDVQKADRQNAKPVNFGFVYGLGAEKFVIYAKANYGVTMTLSQSKKFRSRYFEGYSGIRAWQERALRDGKRSQETRTIAGRRRFLRDEKAHNEFLNSPVQGTGADGLKVSLAIVYKRLKELNGAARMVHMVHDEIILEVRNEPEIVERAKQILEAGMIAGMQPFLKKVPVLAEASSGPDWSSKA